MHCKDWNNKDHLHPMYLRNIKKAVAPDQQLLTVTSLPTIGRKREPMKPGMRLDRQRLYPENFESPAGLLAHPTSDAFPFLPMADGIGNSGVNFRNRSRAYSCGDSSGFTPDSLFIRTVRTVAEPITETKISVLSSPQVKFNLIF